MLLLQQFRWFLVSFSIALLRFINQSQLPPSIAAGVGVGFLSQNNRANRSHSMLVGSNYGAFPPSSPFAPSPAINPVV